MCPRATNGRGAGQGQTMRILLAPSSGSNNFATTAAASAFAGKATASDGQRRSRPRGLCRPCDADAAPKPMCYVLADHGHVTGVLTHRLASAPWACLICRYQPSGKASQGVEEGRAMLHDAGSQQPCLHSSALADCPRNILRHSKLQPALQGFTRRSYAPRKCPEPTRRCDTLH